MTWKAAHKGHEDVVGATLFLSMFPGTQGAGESASMTILVKMGNDSEITLSGFFLLTHSLVRDYYANIRVHVLLGPHSFPFSGKLISELVLLYRYL